MNLHSNYMAALAVDHTLFVCAHLGKMEMPVEEETEEREKHVVCHWCQIWRTLEDCKP